MKIKLSALTIGLVFSLLSMTSMVQAQAKVGLRAGVLMSKQDFQNGGLEVDVKSKLGADIALVADFSISPLVSISPEFHWIQKGGKVEDLGGTIGEVSSTFNYLEIPLLFKLHFGEEVGFFLLAGPSFGYLLNGSDKDNDGNTNDIDLDFYKRAELGAHIGGGITLGPVNVDVRYIVGLSNIFDDNTQLEITNRGFGAGLSLMF